MRSAQRWTQRKHPGGRQAELRAANTALQTQCDTLSALRADLMDQLATLTQERDDALRQAEAVSSQMDAASAAAAEQVSPNGAPESGKSGSDRQPGRTHGA